MTDEESALHERILSRTGGISSASLNRPAMLTSYEFLDEDDAVKQVISLMDRSRTLVCMTEGRFDPVFLIARVRFVSGSRWFMHAVILNKSWINKIQLPDVATLTVKRHD